MIILKYRYKNEPCRGRQNGGWDFTTAGTEWVQGERKLAEEIKSTPRPPETDGVSGRTFAKVRGRFSRSLANRKTTRGKRAGRWRAVVWPHLHIDDGSMGGGGTITHHDKFTDDVESDCKDNYFSNERKGIFHYCVFAHKNKDGSNTKLGSADGPGYFFVIFDANSDDGNKKQEIEFMHELGHNLIGHWNPGNRDHNPNADHLKNRDGNDSNGREHCMNNCALKRAKDTDWFTERPVNYCSDCCDAIRFDGLDGDFTN